MMARGPWAGTPLAMLPRHGRAANAPLAHPPTHRSHPRPTPRESHTPAATDLHHRVATVCLCLVPNFVPHAQGPLWPLAAECPALDARSHPRRLPRAHSRGPDTDRFVWRATQHASAPGLESARARESIKLVPPLPANSSGSLFHIQQTWEALTRGRASAYVEMLASGPCRNPSRVIGMVGKFASLSEPWPLSCRLTCEAAQMRYPTIRHRSYARRPVQPPCRAFRRAARLSGLDPLQVQAGAMRAAR